MKDDHRSYIRNFNMQLRKESLKKIQACSGFEPLTSAPSCLLVSFTGRALHRYRRGQGFESRNSDDHPSFNTTLLLGVDRKLE